MALITGQTKPASGVGYLRAWELAFMYRNTILNNYIPLMQSDSNSESFAVAFHDIRRLGIEFQNIAGIPGIVNVGAFAVANPEYNVVNELLAILMLINDFLTAGKAVLTDEHGKPKRGVWAEDGTYVPESITVAEMVDVKNKLQLVADAITVV